MTYGTRRARLATLLAAGALVLAGLSGCGKGGGDDDEINKDALKDGDKGTTTFRGQFANVKDAPDDAGEVTGLAEMVVGKGRTTIDILVSGLTADTTYYGTVNTQECSADPPGGPIYKFDPDKPEEDPNVVKFEMGVLQDKDTKLAAGSNAEKTYKEEASPDAKSVIIALKRKPKATEDEKDPPTIACADLKPAGEASSPGGASPSSSPSASPGPVEDEKGGKKASASPSPSSKSKKSTTPGPSPSEGS